MRVLMISAMTPHLPCRDGFRLIPANLLRQLSAQHEFCLLARATGEESPEELEWARPYCSELENRREPAHSGLPSFRLAGLEQAAARSIDRLRPDLVHLEGPGLAPIAAAAHQAGCPVVLSAHDSLSYRHRDFAGFAPNWQRWLREQFTSATARHFERRWYREPDAVVVTSDTDAEWLQLVTRPEGIHVIPNGVDLAHWAFDPQPVPGRAVFSGNMSWPPNVDAAIWFADAVLPSLREKHPEAHFVIVGADPSPAIQALAERDGIQVTGRVDDMRTWVGSASAYACPLRFGAGVKNKILEAMALGAPIAATPLSLSGTPLENERHLLVARDADEMIESVGRLISDAPLRKRLAAASRAECERNYSWSAVAERFARIYDEVAGPASTSV